MAKSPPSSPFYWNDYYRDTRVLQPDSRGVWMDMLCKLHEAGRRGDVSMPLQSWLAWCGCPQDYFLAAARDISLTEVGVITVSGCDMSQSVTLYHDDVTAIVTVKNRRMVRESKVRESDKLRQRSSRASRASHASSNAPVQQSHSVPSSSFSSSPSHWEPPNPLTKVAVTASSEEDGNQRRDGVMTRMSGTLKQLFGQHLGVKEPDAVGGEGAA